MSRKLSLDAESLAVESFPTLGAAPAHGTVRGHESLEGGGDDPMPTPPVVVDDCTWFESCFCRTAYAVCGNRPGHHPLVHLHQRLALRDRLRALHRVLLRAGPGITR